MWLGTSVERNRCPDEFQARITEIGGLNRYDEPNFRLIWGQTETYRAGGQWAGNGQVTFKGYRDLLIGMGEPCWILQEWQAPEKYGTPESYYVFNFDDETGLQTLGEYPYSGRYETVLPLLWKGLVNGRLVIEHMRLSSLLIDLIVPIMIESAQLSAARKRALMLKHKEDQDREQLNQIEAGLADAFPAFGTASRSSAYLECNSVVQKKAEAIERHWRNAVATIKARGRGLTVG